MESLNQNKLKGLKTIEPFIKHIFSLISYHKTDNCFTKSIPIQALFLSTKVVTVISRMAKEQLTSLINNDNNTDKAIFYHKNVYTMFDTLKCLLNDTNNLEEHLPNGVLYDPYKQIFFSKKPLSEVINDAISERSNDDKQNFGRLKIVFIKTNLKCSVEEIVFPMTFNNTSTNSEGSDTCLDDHMNIFISIRSFMHSLSLSATCSGEAMNLNNRTSTNDTYTSANPEVIFTAVPLFVSSMFKTTTKDLEPRLFMFNQPSYDASTFININQEIQQQSSQSSSVPALNPLASWLCHTNIYGE